MTHDPENNTDGIEAAALLVAAVGLILLVFYLHHLSHVIL